MKCQAGQETLAAAARHVFHIPICRLPAVGLEAVCLGVIWLGAVAAAAPLAAADAPPVKLRTQLSADRLQVAQPLRLTVVAQMPDGVSLQWPAAAETLGPFNVRGTQDVRDIPTDTGRKSIRVYQLDSYESGSLEIPPITLTYTDRRPPATGAAGTDAAVTGTVQTPSLPVTVTSVLESQTDPTQFRGIKGVVDLPSDPPRRSAAAVAATGAGVLFIAGVGVAALRWYRRRQPTAAQRALSALAQLEQQTGAGDRPLEPVVTQVTSILRRYIELRFQIAAPRLTTHEFLQHARDTNAFDQAQQQRLGDFLTLADMVKFAGCQPDAAALRQPIAQARQFVLQTQRQAAASGAAASGSAASGSAASGSVTSELAASGAAPDRGER